MDLLNATFAHFSAWFLRHCLLRLVGHRLGKTTVDWLWCQGYLWHDKILASLGLLASVIFAVLSGSLHRLGGEMGFSLTWGH